MEAKLIYFEAEGVALKAVKNRKIPDLTNANKRVVRKCGWYQ